MSQLHLVNVALLDTFSKMSIINSHRRQRVKSVRSCSWGVGSFLDAGFWFDRSITPWIIFYSVTNIQVFSVGSKDFAGSWSHLNHVYSNYNTIQQHAFRKTPVCLYTWWRRVQSRDLSQWDHFHGFVAQPKLSPFVTKKVVGLLRNIVGVFASNASHTIVLLQGTGGIQHISEQIFIPCNLRCMWNVRMHNCAFGWIQELQPPGVLLTL